MKMVDKIGRKRRYAPPRPSALEVRPTQHQIDGLIHHLNLFGPLTTPYVQELGGYKDRNACQHALQKLYDGSCATREEHVIEDGKDITAKVSPEHVCVPVNYLVRYNTYLDQPLIHDINDRARRILKRQGKLSPSITHHDDVKHRTLNAAIVASFKLAIQKQSGTFSGPEILFADKVKNHVPLPLTANKKWEPDYLFQLEYLNGGKRVLALETDRATENYRYAKRGDTTRESIEGKFMNIELALRKRLYLDHWGFKGIIPLFASNDLTWLRSCQRLWLEIAPHYSERMLFKYIPYFTDEFSVAPIMWDMLDGWVTGSGKPFELSKP